jgi:CRP/FNR family transcriptional regulator, cyclic AMP receptor protein
MNEYFCELNLQQWRGMVIAMLNRSDHPAHFKLKLCNVLCADSLRTRTIKLAKGSFVYTFGAHDAMVYYIASGQVKLLTATPEGKACVLAIRFAGDIFGELCLSGCFSRTESAVAMQDSRLHAISYTNLLNLLKTESMLEDLVQYLASYINRQQETISSLVSANSEQRLAKALVQLGVPLARSGAQSLTMVPRISHEDLASMIGTTRSRVGLFLNKFREMGLIRLHEDRSLTIDAARLELFSAVKNMEDESTDRPLQFAAASSNSEAGGNS